MSTPIITGLDLKNSFYIDDKCVYEKEIERIYDESIKKICPEVIINKLRLPKGQTDGMFQFKNGNDTFWTIQECKRDIGFKSINVYRAFLQTLCYLCNFYYEINPIYGVDKFKGIFLDSARFFCYIPKFSIDPLMEEIKPSWDKYLKRVYPSQAHNFPTLFDWSKKKFSKIEKYVYTLDENFRLDIFIKDLYANKF